MNKVSVNFQFLFGILSDVHKLYLSHVAKKTSSGFFSIRFDTNLAVQP